MIKKGNTVTIISGEYKGKMGVVAHIDIDFDIVHVILKPSNTLVTNLYTEDVNKVTGVKLAEWKDIQEQYNSLMAQHS